MNYSEKYRQRGKFWAELLVLLPGVRTVLLSGSLVQDKANEKSDIDIFIITRNGQIWTACFMVKFVLRLFNRLANSEKNHAGKICPNHFITDADLVIKEQDAYAADLFSNVDFLAGDIGIYKSFADENEEWIRKFLLEHNQDTLNTKECNTLKAEILKQVQNDKSYISWVKINIEKLLRWSQIGKIKNNPNYLLSGAKIVLEDNELRFHAKPKNRDFTV